MLRRARAILCICLTTLFWTSCLPVVRAVDEDERASAHHTERDHLVLGMKAVSTFEHTAEGGRDATLSGFGIAGMLETTILHGALGLELDLVFTAPGEDVTMAGEPLVKLPWHLRPWLEPYAAAGPVVLRIQEPGDRRLWLGGGQLILGAFLWFAEVAGVDLDVALGAARGPELTVTELNVAIGPVLRN